MKWFNRRKVLSVILAITLVFGAIDTFVIHAEGGTPGAYVAKSSEKWIPSASNLTTTDGALEYNKKVTQRPGEDIWDVELYVKAKKQVVSVPLEVSLVLDMSGSMNLCIRTDHSNNANSCSHTKTEANPQRLTILKQATCDLLDMLYAAGNVSVSITTFSDSSSVKQNMTALNSATTLSNMKKTVNDLTASGWTNMSAGITTGNGRFSSSTASSKYMILLSDGQASAGGNADNGEEYTAHATAAKNAATTVKNQGKTIYTIGLCTANNKNGAEATLKAIATSESNFYGADNLPTLKTQFTEIATQITAMVHDTMGPLFSPPAAASVSVTVKNGSTTLNSGTVTTTVNGLMWTPKDGSISSGTEVTIKYSVKLANIPDPESATNKDGIFGSVDTNTEAFVQYKQTSDSSMKKATFPQPKVRFETGKITANWVAQATDAQGNLVYNSGSPVYVNAPQVYDTSANVITDFKDANGLRINNCNRVNLLKPLLTMEDDEYIYELVRIEQTATTGVELPNGEEYTVASLGTNSDTATFVAGLPTGTSKLLYVYKATPKGYINVKKTVTGMTDANKEYSFILYKGQITDSNPAVFKTFKLKAGEELKITVPIGQEFFLVEEGASVIPGVDYAYDGTLADSRIGTAYGSGTVTGVWDSANLAVKGIVAPQYKNDTKQMVFVNITNQYSQAALVLYKYLDGDSTISGVDRTFWFEITGGGLAAAKLVSVTVKAGQASGYVSVVLPRPASGNYSYTVTELDNATHSIQVARYTVETYTASGSAKPSAIAGNKKMAQTVSIGKTNTQSAAFLNQYTAKTTAELTVEKTFTNPGGNPGSQGFLFTLEKKGVDGQFVPYATTGTNANGQFTISVAPGQTNRISFSGLPAGTYCVKEAQKAISGYEWVSTANAITGAVKGDGSNDSDTLVFFLTGGDEVKASFTNTYRQLGSLTIKKEFAGTTSRPQSVTFTITGPNNYSNTVTLPQSGAWELTLNNLPQGTYTVTETAPGNTSDGLYAFTKVEVSTGGAYTNSSSANASVTPGGSASVTFRNTYSRITTDLIVQKSVAWVGTGGTAPASYVFQLKDAGGNVISLTAQEGGYAYNGIDNTGNATFSVPTNGQVAITGLPANVQYTVIEQASGAITYYNGPAVQYSVNGGTAANGTSANITLSASSANTVAFTNTYTRKTASLTVGKAVAGLYSGDSAPASYSFTLYRGTEAVKLFDDASGRVYSINSQGSTTFTVPTGGSVTINGLEDGIEYTVVEASSGRTILYYDGPVVSYSVNGGVANNDDEAAITINAAATNAIAFTNSYSRTQVNLTITKQVVGPANDSVFAAPESFAFEVSKDGSSNAVSVILDANDYNEGIYSKTIQVDAGYAYTVTELATGLAVTDYVLSTTADDGAALADRWDADTRTLTGVATGSTVAFVNTYAREMGILRIFDQSELLGVYGDVNDLPASFTVNVKSTGENTPDYDEDFIIDTATGSGDILLPVGDYIVTQTNQTVDKYQLAGVYVNEAIQAGSQDTLDNILSVSIVPYDIVDDIEIVTNVAFLNQYERKVVGIHFEKFVTIDDETYAYQLPDAFIFDIYSASEGQDGQVIDTVTMTLDQDGNYVADKYVYLEEGDYVVMERDASSGELYLEVSWEISGSTIAQGEGERTSLFSLSYGDEYTVSFYNDYEAPIPEPSQSIPLGDPSPSPSANPSPSPSANPSPSPSDETITDPSPSIPTDGPVKTGESIPTAVILAALMLIGGVGLIIAKGKKKSAEETE